MRSAPRARSRNRHSPPHCSEWLWHRRTRPTERKLAALKFLGHWVGDVHQPLHVGFRDDRGCSHVRTLGSSCGNLLTLWDSCIVEERLGMHPFAIAREPDVGHCMMVGDTCQYAAEFEEGEPERVMVVDDGYLDRHASIARERISMAGVRWAGSSIGR